MDDDTPIRADIWLWAARFFKTRRLSREALDGGKIELNGAACKPAKPIKPGDRLRITRGRTRLDIEVLALSTRRSPASVAQTLYRETEASRARREEQRETARLRRPVKPTARPDKAARRQLRRIKRGD